MPLRSLPPRVASPARRGHAVRAVVASSASGGGGDRASSFASGSSDDCYCCPPGGVGWKLPALSLATSSSRFSSLSTRGASSSSAGAPPASRIPSAVPAVAAELVDYLNASWQGRHVTTSTLLYSYTSRATETFRAEGWQTATQPQPQRPL